MADTNSSSGGNESSQLDLGQQLLSRRHCCCQALKSLGSSCLAAHVAIRHATKQTGRLSWAPRHSLCHSLQRPHLLCLECFLHLRLPFSLCVGRSKQTTCRGLPSRCLPTTAAARLPSKRLQTRTHACEQRGAAAAVAAARCRRPGRRQPGGSQHGSPHKQACSLNCPACSPLQIFVQRQEQHFGRRGGLASALLAPSRLADRVLLVHSSIWHPRGGQPRLAAAKLAYQWPLQRFVALGVPKVGRACPWDGQLSALDSNSWLPASKRPPQRGPAAGGASGSALQNSRQAGSG